MNEKVKELRTRLHEINDIQSTISLLGWDQSTYMPKAGVDSRGSQMATLGAIAHQKLTAPEIGRLLDDLKSFEQSLPDDSDEASLIRLTRREYDQAIRIPSNFISKVYNHTAKTYKVWTEAREEDNFGKVAPLLEKTLEFSREYSNYFPGYGHIADPLIDRSDFGMKASVIKKIFSDLRQQLVPFVQNVLSHKSSNSCLKQKFPKEKQLEFGKHVIEQLGFDFTRGRLDISPHPFMTKFAHGDVRITTRVCENDLGGALFSSIHETGHALYELGINKRYEGTPLHKGISSGVHESQSRLWENIVGRSLHFWKHFYPKLQQMFPSQLGDVSLKRFYQAINHVERSLIRTESDELTYNLHVIIRFDLELELLEGKLDVKNLPNAWRERYQSDLGISTPGDKNGVLQDIHWFSDFIGGAFQGYTLGNILSCQFYAAAKQANPQIEYQMEKGDFSLLHDWLKENLYRYGKKFTAEEIVKRVTGSSLNIKPYLEYLQKKYSELYLGK